MRTAAVIGLVLLVGNASGGAFAAGGKNVEPLLCHLMKPLACDARNNCGFSTAEIMHLPEFVKVDVAAMTISGEEPGGFRAVTVVSPAWPLFTASLAEDGCRRRK